MAEGRGRDAPSRSTRRPPRGSPGSRSPHWGGRAVGLLLLVATALVSAPGDLVAQKRDPDRIRTAFPGRNGERILQLIREAERDGLPVDPLMEKALEGSAKRAPPGQVLKAVAEYADQLREARSLIGRSGGEKGLVQAAEALRRGIEGSTVRSFARSHPRDLSMLLVVMGDLLGEGVPQPAARGLVEEAAARGYRGNRLLSLTAAVRGFIRRGQMRPADAADSVRKGLGGG
ncbi:MAG: hypothetical protein ACE5HP_10470 [Gemmatimonadota bacterium]